MCVIISEQHYKTYAIISWGNEEILQIYEHLKPVPISSLWFPKIGTPLKITLTIILLQGNKVAMKYVLIVCKISSQAVSFQSVLAEKKLLSRDASQFHCGRVK